MKKRIKLNAGMTYVELAVVLSIFAVMSTVAIFSHEEFQAKVDVKNMASDIALKIVEAQKSSLAGLWDIRALNPNWKPAYGVYFNLSTDNKSFIYFADLDGEKDYDGEASCNRECLGKISITKNNSISDIYVPSIPAITNLTISFTRPDSGAHIFANGVEITGNEHAQITVTSPQGPGAKIKLYPSGRIELK